MFAWRGEIGAEAATIVLIGAQPRTWAQRKSYPIWVVAAVDFGFSPLAYLVGSGYIKFFLACT